MPMIPYWVLFIIFAGGALLFFSDAPLPAAAAAGSYPPERPAAASPGRRRTGLAEWLLSFAALLTAAMIGLRYGVGTDFGAYADMFDNISRRGLGWGLTRIDPAYGFINWAAAALGFDFWLVNLICGLIFMYGLTHFARRQPNPWLAIAVAVPYLIIGVGMGYSRQAVAIALMMVGLTELSKSSFFRFVLWVLAAALFHRTVVIVIPIVAISFSRNRFEAFAIGAVGCMAGYYLLSRGESIEYFQHGYVTYGRESSGAGIRLAMNVPPALIYLSWSRRFTSDETERLTWRNFALIAILSSVAWLMIAASTALDRMALYIIPLQIFVFSRIPTALSGGRKGSRPLVAAVLAYSAAVEFVWLNYSNNARYWLPYSTYPRLLNSESEVQEH
jgi:hypothetical protein